MSKRELWNGIAKKWKRRVKMKWIDDMKEADAAFKEWGRLLTIIGGVIAGSLVVIAAELLVICIKI